MFSFFKRKKVLQVPPENSEVLEGGVGDDKTLSDLATKHNVPIEQIKAELEKGAKVEAEHTSDPKVAADIARDHLTEDPLYYEKLAKMEAKPAEVVPPAPTIDEIIAKAVAAAVEKVALQFALKAQEQQAALNAEVEKQKAEREAESQAQKAKHDAELRAREQQIEELKRTAPTGVPNQQVQMDGSIDKNAVEKAHEIAQSYRQGYGFTRKR